MNRSLLAAIADGQGSSVKEEPQVAARQPGQELRCKVPEGWLGGLVASAYPSDLSAAMATVKLAVRSGTGLPVLRGVLVQADARLTFTATDLQTYTERTVPGAAIAAPGRALVPAALLDRALAALDPDEPVHLQYLDDRLTLTQGYRTLTLDGLPVADFPAPRDPGPVVATAAAPALADALARTAACASADDARPALGSVYLVLEEGRRTAEVVATDSYRLGLLELNLEEPARASAAVLIPREAALAFARVLKGAGVARIRTSEAAFGIDVEAGGSAVRAVTRLVEGHFPNYRNLVPEKGDVLEVGTDELRKALRRASVFTDGNPVVKLKVDVLAGDPFIGTVEVLAAGASLGAYREHLPTATYSGDESRTVAYNPDYLDGGLAFAQMDRVSILVPPNGGPARIDATGGLYLLMPVRLQEAPEEWSSVPATQGRQS